MTKVQEKHHYYTDQERYEYCIRQNLTHLQKNNKSLF